MEAKWKSRVGWGVMLGILLTVLVFFRTIVHFITEVLWYKEVGYLGTYYRILFSKVVVAIPLFFIIFTFLILYTEFLKRRYQSVTSSSIPPEQKDKTTKFLLLAIGLFSLVCAYVVSDAHWMQILQFAERTPFGLADPIFNRDISFYLFVYPLLKSIFAFSGAIIAMLGVLTVAYFLYLYGKYPPPDAEQEPANQGSGIRSINAGVLPRILLTMLLLVGSLFFFMLSAKYHLDSYELLFSPDGAVFGATYTDVNVTMRFNRIYSIASLIIGVLLLFGIRGKLKNKVIFGSALLLVIISLVGNGVKLGVQNLVVAPNELKMERPYIEHSIKYTNAAYGLDRIEIRDFEADQTLTREDIENNEETLLNVSINDERPALEAFNQLQGFRGYYRFYDVDIDRYTIDGKIQQIFLSARELDKTMLDENAQSWVNSKLKYTHGYGLAAAPASKVNSVGQPEMVVRDMPVSSTFPQLKVTQPRIYFGELTDDYIIVNTTEDEFDYPKGETDEITEYEGQAGIKLGILNRLLFAIKYNDWKLLISSGINADSQILSNRNVVERVQKIAPFLSFDEDAYAVIVEGKIYFVIEGYTSGRYYPYSEPYDISGNNYIRNSVKAVVDAYDGNVTFYISDEKDPIITTYSKIFKNMFVPMSKMDPELRAHMRYPKHLFEIMSEMYLTFHATDPNIFYNRGDKWAIPTEAYQNEERKMQPLYFTFKLPGEDKAEFLLSIPFTPLGKQTLSAFLVARNDGAHYGELVLYRFPKDRSIIGPQQVEAQISNNDIISRDLSLWNSQGSEVIRGHILTIPMETSVMYIEPLYIRASSQTAIPEVKRIIVAYNNRIVMAETLDLALEKIFGKADESNDGTTPGETPPDIGLADAQDPYQVIMKANELFERAQEALRNGSLSEYESLINEMGNILKSIDQ